MNCEICLYVYDHSKRKPYVLSCPHRFCLDCMNRKLVDKKCPLCHKPIRSKFPNLTLMKTLPESVYDKTKKDVETIVIETNELKVKINQQCERKFTDSLYRLQQQRQQFNKKALDLINLIKLNQSRVLDEFNVIEADINKNFNEIKEQSQIDLDMKYAKSSLDNNDLDDLELLNLKENFELKKFNLIHNIEQMDKFNADYDLLYNETINVKNGIFVQLKKSEQKIEITDPVAVINVLKSKENAVEPKIRTPLRAKMKQLTINQPIQTAVKRLPTKENNLVQKDTPKKRKMV